MLSACWATFQPCRPGSVADYVLAAVRHLSKMSLLALPRRPVLLIIPSTVECPDLGGYALDGTSQVRDVHMQALPSRMR